MSEWIKDRLPTKEDGDVNQTVWVYYVCGGLGKQHYSLVLHGQPWTHIEMPKPYVKPEPQRWMPDYRQPYYCIGGDATVYRDIYEDQRFDIAKYNFGNCFKTRAQAIEAARRVRELLLNYHKELSHE